MKGGNYVTDRLITQYNFSGKYTSNGLLSGYQSVNFNSIDPNNNILLKMNDGTNDLLHKQSWVDFDRFYAIDLENELPSGRHYIFMCRPDLNLVEGNTNSLTLSSDSRVNVDPYFTYLSQFHPEIIASLTSEFAGMKSTRLRGAGQTGDNYASAIRSDGTTYLFQNHHAFIPYITTRIESLQLPDYRIKDNTIVQPYTKYTMPYTTSALESTTGGSLDITFREDKYYSLHKLFYAWVYYQNNVMRNIFKPKNRYIRYNELDYATSIYDFIVDETGENIIYWAKYTGCVPTSVPMSDMSFNRNSGAETKITIPFSYFYCEHMDQNILMDFQYNSLGYYALNNYFPNNKMFPFDISNTIPIYNADTFLGKNFVGRPVIFYGNDKKFGKTFKLRWFP